MTAYVRREYPLWSWSFSRQQIFEACPRRYYYNYYGSHNGWEYSAPPKAAAAYRLKKLSNIYLVLGEALHQSAEKMVRRVAEGRGLFSAQETEEMIRQHLRRVWRSSREQREAFFQRPNRVAMLHEFYYGEGPPPEVVERINHRATQVAQALVASPTWLELQDPGSRLISAEQFDTFWVEGTPVYAVPDLLFRTKEGLWLIVDWKSGEAGEQDRAQVGLYALYVQAKHGVSPQEIKVRLEYLSLNEQVETLFSQEELQEVRQNALASIQKMQSFLRDAALNAPRPIQHFPLTERRQQCPYCNFYELCREELEQKPAAPEVS